MEKGMKYVLSSCVTEENTAVALRSGSLRVFSTVALIQMIEEAAVKCLSGTLEEGTTTVGIKLDIDHVLASPVGSDVKVEVEVTDISENGKIITFDVKAYDVKDLIGEGTHKRAVIKEARFLEKCYSKLEGR
ncbi:MAG: dihydrolipoamide acyltransferase [Clostridia bacterium]|nr:dihydrolipoamide acyltransferase [Clostridia bacterium]